jgi:hypothetical protein
MSPYNMKNGDTPKSDAWMEKCVSSITGKNKRTGKPYTEGERIAICKTQYEKSKGAEFTSIDEDILRSIENLELRVVAQLFKNKRVYNASGAMAIYEMLLAKSGYDPKILELLLEK